jgi:hypothetical protein
VTATSPNFGWVYPNSGADPVSAQQNFAHVGAIDATLASMTNGLIGIRTGTTLMEPGGGTDVIEVPVTWAPLPVGATMTVTVTSRTSRPDTVDNQTFGDLTESGMTLYAYRQNSTTSWTVYWAVFAFQDNG